MHKIQLASTCRGEIVDYPQVPVKPTMLAASAGASTDASAGQCQQCVLYHDILGDTLRDFLDVHWFSNTMSTASKNQWHLDMRRASTFNLLHEAAVIKESSTPASDELAQQVRGINTSTSASLQQASIAEVAEQELHRLRALPPTSHKWTWGESLTDAEVVALRRSGTRPAQASHSGYNISLREGRLTGEVSSPSLPTSHGRYGDILFRGLSDAISGVCPVGQLVHWTVPMDFPVDNHRKWASEVQWTVGDYVTAATNNDDYGWCCAPSIVVKRTDVRRGNVTVPPHQNASNDDHRSPSVVVKESTPAVFSERPHFHPTPPVFSRYRPSSTNTTRFQPTPPIFSQHQPFSANTPHFHPTPPVFSRVVTPKFKPSSPQVVDVTLPFLILYVQDPAIVICSYFKDFVTL
ncbi:hypothetical protein BYT27DRAFT_7241109 [Phlegmacium glaucopus]|nr:hypothetical protein BYT27DRAFT_7241109 [Phlegmacium glaucopus]